MSSWDTDSYNKQRREAVRTAMDILEKAGHMNDWIRGYLEAAQEPSVQSVVEYVRETPTDEFEENNLRTRTAELVVRLRMKGIEEDYLTVYEVYSEWYHAGKEVGKRQVEGKGFDETAFLALYLAEKKIKELTDRWTEVETL